MSCTPCTPPQDEFPIFCDPNPATDVGQRLLVEDQAFCTKALVSPETASTLVWEDGIKWKETVPPEVPFNETTPFLAEGTTEPRNLVTRFADVVNVKDFGAVGDGVADDTAAIQAAVNFVSAAPLGGLLQFPEGIYETSEITVGQNIIIDGNGSVIRAKTGTSFIFRITGLDNITIQNFIFECANLVESPDPADFLTRAAIYRRVGGPVIRNIKIKNNRFNNLPTDSQRICAVKFNNVSCVVDGNIVDICGGDVFNFNGGFCIVTNNDIRNGQDGGVAINNGASGIISNNLFVKCDLGVGSGPVNSSTDPFFLDTLQITNNTFDSCRYGVNMGWFGYADRDGPQNWVIDGNVFYNCKERGIQYEGRTNTVVVNGIISDNTFYRTGANSFDGTSATEAFDIRLINSGEVVISGNSIKEPVATTTRTGIRIVDSNNISISGNTITANPLATYNYAIRLTSAKYALLSNNNCIVSEMGILVDGSIATNYLVIDNNQIQDFKTQGIRISNPSLSITITNNKLGSTSGIIGAGIDLGTDINNSQCNFNTIRIPAAVAAILLQSGPSNDYDISFNTVFGNPVTDLGTGLTKRIQNNW